VRFLKDIIWLMDLNKIKSVHFVGLKGIGMVALACLAQDLGIKVSGSDLPEVFHTDKIIKQRNFTLYSFFSVQNILNPDLVVYSAGHDGVKNIEVKTAVSLGIPILTQSQFLSLFTKKKKLISIAGVGGKSSTSAMLSTILIGCGFNPSYFIGVAGVDPLGDPGKFDKKGELFVAEADEYFDPKLGCAKFLTQDPETVILPNLAYDHPDVYKNTDDTLSCFKTFLDKIPANGLLIANTDSFLVKKLFTGFNASKISFGFKPGVDALLKTVTNDKGINSFSMQFKGKKYLFSLSVPGKYNILNAAGAILTAFHYGLTYKDVKNSLLSFRGTKRRFEKIYEDKNFFIYDDYAHHPVEIKSLLVSARLFFKHKKLIVVFQPHTYSRTKALLNDFASSFSDCDQVIVCDIFASAREKKDDSVSSKLLADKINEYSKNGLYLAGKKEILSFLEKKLVKNTAILTVGAGNLFHWHSDLIKLLKEKTDRIK